jgi:phenylalanine-4-hydroxylase
LKTTYTIEDLQELHFAMDEVERLEKEAYSSDN